MRLARRAGTSPAGAAIRDSRITAMPATQIVRLDAVKLRQNEAAKRECRWDSYGEALPSSSRTSRITSQIRAPRVAPSATRTPISFVRRATTNAITP